MNDRSSHYFIRFFLYQVKNGHRVEVVTNVKGTTILCHDASPDMYASIDACAAALQRKLRQYKERRTEGWHGGGKPGEEFTALLEEMEAAFALDDGDTATTTNGAVKGIEEHVDFTDPEQPQIMKVNSFQLDKPISVEEAVFALDYVDHDFYVFRNEATNEINVVYKRHTGGVGLVAP
jgi:putative sigma-54 modulation protein